jgi:hypothetical protein
LHIARGAFSAFDQEGNVILLKDKDDMPDNVFPKDMTLYEKLDFYPQIDIIEGMRKKHQHRIGNNR